VLGLEHRAGERWQDRGGRRQQHIEVPAPARHLAPAQELELARRQRVVVGAELAARLTLVDDVRLHGSPVDAVVVGQTALGERDEGRHELFGDRRHLDLLDGVAELLERRSCRARARRARLVGRDAQRGLRHQPDAQRARRRAQLLRERARGDRRVVPGEWVRPGDRVEHRRRVGDRACDHALDDRTEPALRQTRDTPAAGLEADQPAVGGGDANRAAAVVGVGDREHPGCHSRRRAAARAARRARRIPRVAADPVAAVLRDRDHPELGRVGAPAQHEPGALERLDDQLAVLAHTRWGAVGSVGHGPSGHRREVLDRQRHAQERRLLAGRQTAVGLRRGRPRILVVAPDHRVQLGAQLVDRGDARLEQLRRGELAATQRGGELKRR